jgi:hypothetical protein
VSKLRMWRSISMNAIASAGDRDFARIHQNPREHAPSLAEHFP